MPGKARRVSRMAQRNMVSNCRLHTASDVSAAGPGGGPPVLSTRISVCCSTAPRLSIADASARSQARAVIVPRPGGVAATSSFSRSRLRATATTSAPSAAKADAIARPSPRDAPVTNACRFSSPRCIVHIVPYAAPHSEFESEPHAKYPRPGDGLRRNELRARGEHALDHIRQVLGVELRRPRILRNADRCVVLRKRGIFKPEVRRAHGRTGGERGVAAGLGERMAGMRDAGLREGIVRA